MGAPETDSGVETLLCAVMQSVGSHDTRLRDRGADDVTDLCGALSESQVHRLVQLLVRVRLAEGDLQCQESQLNALCVLQCAHGLSDELLAPLHALWGAGLEPSQVEYLEALLYASAPARR